MYVWFYSSYKVKVVGLNLLSNQMYQFQMLIVWRKMEKRNCIVEPLQGSELTAFHYYPDFQVGANHI